VAKSFVILGIPLRYDESFVHIRDTNFLAPTGMKSLKNIGKLSEKEGDLSKREIFREAIVQMSKLIARDKQALIVYAILDSNFTLKHAGELEKLNKSVMQLGIPRTLSSIGRNYVATK